MVHTFRLWGEESLEWTTRWWKIPTFRLERVVQILGGHRKVTRTLCLVLDSPWKRFRDGGEETQRTYGGDKRREVGK